VLLLVLLVPLLVLLLLPLTPSSASYESYNHHYGASLLGKGAELTVHEPRDDEPIQHTHGGPTHTYETPPGYMSNGYPTAQVTTLLAARCSRCCPRRCWR